MQSAESWVRDCIGEGNFLVMTRFLSHANNTGRKRRSPFR